MSSTWQCRQTCIPKAVVQNYWVAARLCNLAVAMEQIPNLLEVLSLRARGPNEAGRFSMHMHANFCAWLIQFEYLI